MLYNVLRELDTAWIRRVSGVNGERETASATVKL